MLIDLHVHTTRGSGDSSLRPVELIAEAQRLGLDGVCLTEHSHLWTDAELAEVAAGSGVRLFRALEVETDVGHVLVIGEKGYVSEMRKLPRLSERADKTGAALVLAHPFRNLHSPGPGRACLLADPAGVGPGDVHGAARIPALRQVHALEAVNGATPDPDNDFAVAVATALGCPSTGGSDAHSTHGLASGVTEIEGDPRDEAELAEAIRAGRIRAGVDLHIGKLRYVDTRAAR